MSFQIANNNTFTTAPTSPNPYISRKLNNMDQAQVMKREREDWLRTYYKMLKGIEVMKDMKKIAEETNMIAIEIVSYTSPPVRKTTSLQWCYLWTIQAHLSRNTSHSSVATLQVFRLPWRRYSYSTWSSMTELILSVSQHWNFCLE